MSYPPEIILRILPHRYPMLMVDKILEHTYGQRAVCQKNVTLGEELLAGHFPGDPIFPGVMMVEMGLQAVQVMLTDLDRLITAAAEPPPARRGVLASIREFRFHKPVRPGDVLRTTVSLKQGLGALRKADVRIVDGDAARVANGVVVVRDAP
jgi:3-hydroxyacyl-[acyl-carrier-protein] dehydratase